MKRLAVLFGGEGTTLQAILDATRDGRLAGASVVRGISSKPAAGGIARCEAAGVPCDVVDRRDHREVMAHSAAVLARLDPREVDLLVLAGWLHRLKLPRVWLDRRALNTHPSLLPAFGGPGMYGRHVHEAVLARGCRVSGCTVHYVDNGLDTGPIIDQRCVAVEADDTPQTLAARVRAAEKELLVDVLARLTS